MYVCMYVCMEKFNYTKRIKVHVTYVIVIVILKSTFIVQRLTARLEARMLAVDLSVLPPAKLVPTFMAR